MPTTTLNVTNKEAFELRLEKLNAKLTKKGLPIVDVLNIDLKLGDDVISEEERIAMDTLYTGYTYRPAKKLSFDITIYLPVPVLEIKDVTWIGKQEAVAGGRKIVVLDKAYDLEPYRSQEMSCDHCGWKRDRKTTYFFLKDGKIMQIGSTCVDEYFGVDLLYLLEEFSGFCSNCSDEEEYGRRPDTFNPFWYHVYMTTAAFYISTEGFKGRKRYEDDSTDAKSSTMAYILTQPTFDRDDKELQRKYDEAYAKFRALLSQNNLGTVLEDAQAYWLTFDKPDTFLQNCKTAILGASLKMQGFFASAMKEYLVTVAKATPVAPTTPILEEFLGEVGDKITVVGKVLKCQFYDNNYAGSFRLEILTDTNHRACWFSTKDPQVLVGNTVQLKGRIKKLDDYNGRKSTVMTRCTLEMLQV